MTDEPGAHHAEQQAHFERGASLIERLVKHTAVPRTMRKKVEYIATRLQGCKRVLEIGTGHGVELGSLLRHMPPGTTYCGIDLATAPLRDAIAAVPEPRRAATNFAAAVVERLPFADEAFDAVFCIDVLHHVKSQPAMLRELRRVLRAGGIVICVEPNRIFPTNVIFLWNELENGLFKLSRANARAWLREADLVDGELVRLPIYFPSFPASLAGFYDAAERVIGAVPILREVSTTRVLVGRRPSTVTAKHA